MRIIGRDVARGSEENPALPGDLPLFSLFGRPVRIHISLAPVPPFKLLAVHAVGLSCIDAVKLMYLPAA